MKTVFSFFAAVLVMAGTNAFANEFDLYPVPGNGSGMGRRPGHPGRGPHPGGFDLCNASYTGSWGRRSLTIQVNRQWGDQVNVTVFGNRGAETLRGNCRYNWDNSAQLSFGGGFNNGNLSLTPNGQASGVVSGQSFYGSIGGGPRPGPDYSRCYGVVNGTWGFKGGRPMTLNIQRAGWGEQVNVIISQANGAEQAQGVCRPNWDGTVYVEFRGSFNSGNITIDAGNRVTGMVSNYGFHGYMN